MSPQTPISLHLLRRRREWKALRLKAHDGTLETHSEEDEASANPLQGGWDEAVARFLKLATMPSKTQTSRIAAAASRLKPAAP